MKAGVFWAGILLAARVAWADGFPVINVHPQNQNFAVGALGSIYVTASGATGYQWRFNGSDIIGATASTLTLANAQVTNSGYYMVLVKNSFGWVPSQLAYVTVGSGGRVPFSNQGGPVANYQVDSYPYGPITNGSAQLVVGPALDQMVPVGLPRAVSNGFYNVTSGRTLPTIAPGQTVFYRVDITYTNPPWGDYAQPSTVIKLTAAAAGDPLTPPANLRFPIYIEWPWPPTPATNSYSSQVRVLGETFTITNWCYTYGDFGVPTWQWRKDGKEFGIPVNLTYFDHVYSAMPTLTITNVQPSDAGIYDLVLLADNWTIGAKLAISVQITNGLGIFESPRINGTTFVSDLIGAASRKYLIQQSTNLSMWADLVTVSNVSGSVTFTNSSIAGQGVFYRAKLLP